MAAKPTYLGAVSSAVAQGLVTGVWTASGELPRSRRRAVRAAAVVSVAAAGVLAERNDDRAVTWTREGGLEVKPEDGADEPRRARGVASAVGIVFGLSMIVGRRQMEKRWLARLRRNGNEHPHRALALRMGLLAIAGTLPGKLMEAHRVHDRTRDRSHGADDKSR